MKKTAEILKKTGISKVAFMKYREFGLVDSYKEKRPVRGKKGGGFQYFYEDNLIEQIREVRRKMSEGISLVRQQKEKWEAQRTIDADIPVQDHTGIMIIDIGKGMTEMAVIYSGGIVLAHSISVGGDDMNKAVIEHMKNKYNLMIEERTAEEIKINIGSAWFLEKELTMDVKGTDPITSSSKFIKVNSAEIREVFRSPLKAIVEATKFTLEKTPPQLADDLVKGGIVLCGGGSLLRGIDRLLSEETGLPVKVDKSTAIILSVQELAKLLRGEVTIEKISTGV